MSSGKARRARDDLQDYRNQNYIGSLLDDNTFDLLNSGEYPCFLHANGCLDAPDFIPAGGMHSITNMLYDRITCERGVSLTEQQRRDAIMNEILAEMD